MKKYQIKYYETFEQKMEVFAENENDAIEKVKGGKRRGIRRVGARYCIEDWVGDIKEDKILFATLEDKRKYLNENYCNGYEIPVDEEKQIKFYWKCCGNDIDFSDADRYAWLNTLFGYDIGIENFLTINSYLWENLETEVLELTHNDLLGLEILCKTCGIDLNFDVWSTEEPEAYNYF